MDKKLIIAILGSIVFLGACGGDKQNQHNDHNHDHHEKMEEQKGLHDKVSQKIDIHSEHESIRDNFANREIIVLKNTYQADSVGVEQLQQLAQSYLLLKNALTEDNVEKTDQAIVEMSKKVRNVNAVSFGQEEQKAWKQHASLYTDKLAEMKHTSSLQEKRSYFSHISEIFYCTVKSFELKQNQKLYAIHCPMAFDKKGAYWIAENKAIKNPYFGNKMLKCGEVKEEL